MQARLPLQFTTGAGTNVLNQKGNQMSGHLTDCTTLLDYDEQTEFHDGPGRCPACDDEMDVISEGERFADFGMGWVTSGGDPADARAAWAQDKALIAQREEAERNQRIEDEVTDAYAKEVKA